MTEEPNNEKASGESEKKLENNEKSSKELSPEEQMAKFEEAMKNEDWGHQPC